MDSDNKGPQNSLFMYQPRTNPMQPGPLPTMMNPSLFQEIQVNPMGVPINGQMLSPLQATNGTAYIQDPMNIQDHNQPDPPKANNNPESDQKNDESSQKSQKHIKRRSKSELEGRTFVCKFCSKSYLSYPALYTHCKQKHNTNNSSGRGRGRPKKEQGETNGERNKYNPLNASFFLKSDRTGNTKNEEINSCIERAFKFIYEDNEENKKRNDARNMKNYNYINDHVFFKKFLSDSHEVNKHIENDKEITDLVLIDYLNKMSTHCNPEYYVNLIVFVTLFREHVNQVKKTKDSTIDFTEENEAEDVPDSSNEFITDFLDPEGKDNDFGFTKEEAIDLTQNLCYWMYDNNFTCSKLSLIHNEKQ